MSKVLFLYPNLNSYGLTPIGISITSALLKKYGHQTDLFDTTFIDCKDFFAPKTDAVYTKKMEQLMFFKPVDLRKVGVCKEKKDVVEEFRKKVNAFKPDIIAFSFWSCQLTGEEEGMMYERGKKLLEVANINYETTGIHIIAGGIQPSLEPEKVLDDGVTDIVCIGEGELAYLELAEFLKEKKDIYSIKNLWIKQDNKIYKNSLRPLIENLDDLPFADFDLFDDKSFYRPYHGKIVRGIDYEFTRGCINQCYYCVGPQLRKLYDDKKFRREKSIKRIIEEISYLKNKYKLDIIRYQDELFLGMEINKLKQLAKEYRTKVNLPFIIETSVNSLNPDTIECLKTMGCLSVSVGIEHGNEKFREQVLNKFYSNSQAIEAFRLLKKNGISVHAYAMLGFPDETRKLAFDTINLLKYLKVSTYQVSIFQPFYGTELRKICLKKGLINENDKMLEFVSGTILKNTYLSEKEILGLQRTFSMYVYSPKTFWFIIKIAEQNDFVYKILLRIFQFFIRISLH
ncbi:MAG TPA: radical SAM protein [bacterium]|nr:radical SAM protein [bacterium]